jgi:uncharacterized protein with PQ loop repeat
MNDAFIIGFIAGGLMTFGQIAQLYKALNNGKTSDISIIFLLISLLGTLLYAYYAYMFQAWAMLIWCLVSLVVLSSLCVLKGILERYVIMRKTNYRIL